MVAAVVVAAGLRMCALVRLWRCVAARVWRRVRGGGGVCVCVCLLPLPYIEPVKASAIVLDA